MHQWHEPTAQLTALLVPPPDGEVTALAEDMATEPLIRVVSAQWRHITLTTLGRAMDASDQQLTTLAEELAEG